MDIDTVNEKSLHTPLSWAIFLKEFYKLKNVKVQSPPKTFFLGKYLRKNYSIFTQISLFIWKYNPVNNGK